MSEAALAGVIVIELGERRAASACGLLLAQAGATVIVVEPEDAAPRDKWKSRATLLAGKRSLVRRDGNVDDERLVDQALRGADVVLLSSDVDAPFAAEAMRRVEGRGIVCDITAFGPDAPPERRGWPEKLIQAYAGVADVTGPADAPPTLGEVAALEFHAAIYAAAGVVAALAVRDRDGTGQRVDISIYECGVNSLATYLPLHYGGKPTRRAGNRHPMAAPWNAFRASDGWVLMCSAKDEHWVRLCDIMGTPELAREGDLVKLVDRIAHVDAVDAAVNAWTGTMSVEDCVARLSAGDIASGPITEVRQFEHDANIAHRRMARRLLDPASGRDALVAGTPLKASRTGGVAPGAAPLPGEAHDFVRSLVERGPPQATGKARLPCEGLRVIEIGQYTTAPLCARQLFSLGAEVIKVEPLDGEASRAWPPHQSGTGYFFAMSNSGKRSVSLDLREAGDRAIFRGLLEQSDVLVENMKPGSLSRLGFSPGELEAINPRLVYCGISGFGADSMHPGRPAFDTVVQAMSGLMDLTRVEGVPMKLGISAGDITGGILALFSILVMLAARERTGLGQGVDLAMQDAAVWMTQTNWNGEAPDPCVLIEARDGHVAVEAGRAAVDAALAGTGVLSRAQTVALLARAGLRAAPVRSVAEIAEDPDTVSQGLIRWRELDGLRWPLLGSPVRLSATPPVVGRPIGPLGEGRDRAVEIAAGQRRTRDADDTEERRQFVG